MFSFDFHAHVFTDEVAEKLISKMEVMYGVKRSYNATINELLFSAEKGGVDRIVVLPIANRPEHARYNEWYALLGKSYEQIIPFGSLHPENDPNELDSFQELGLRGLKFQPNAQRFFPDDKRMWPIYKKASELDLIIVFHAGHEEGGVQGEFSQPDRFTPVIESFPDLRIVLAHFGGYKVWDKIDCVLGYDNVYFDTAHLPGHIDDELFKSLAQKLGLDRIVFGTDFPFGDHQTERSYIEKLFGQDIARKFISENPSLLLNL